MTHSPTSIQQFTHVVFVAVLLGSSFYLNTIMCLYTGLNVIKGVDLIFLPAFIKVAAVVIFGWRGALGLLLGIIPVANYDNRDPLLLVIDLLIFSTGPMIAFLLVKKTCGLPDSLAGFRPKHIFYLAITAALIQSMNKYIHHFDVILSAELFAGDVIGTLVMLFTLSIIMRALEFRNKKHKQKTTLAG